MSLWGNEWGKLTWVCVNVWLDMRIGFLANVFIYTEIRDLVVVVVLLGSSQLSFCFLTRSFFINKKASASYTKRTEVGSREAFFPLLDPSRTLLKSTLADGWTGPRCKERKLSYFLISLLQHGTRKTTEQLTTRFPYIKKTRDTAPLILYSTTPSNIPVGPTVPFVHCMYSHHSVTVHWLDVQRSFIAAINFLLRQFGNHCYRENLKGGAGQQTVFIICGPYLLYAYRIYYMRIRIQLFPNSFDPRILRFRMPHFTENICEKSAIFALL
jgi:hypothetical protein